MNFEKTLTKVVDVPEMPSIFTARPKEGGPTETKALHGKQIFKNIRPGVKLHQARFRFILRPTKAGNLGEKGKG